MLGEKPVWQDFLICAAIVTGAFLVGEALVDEVWVPLNLPLWLCAVPSLAVGVAE